MGITIANTSIITIAVEMILVFFLLNINSLQSTLFTERILYIMYPIFASFVIFVIFLSWSLHRHKNDDRLKTEEFFQKERRANSARKKSIENLDYIEIPETLLDSSEHFISTFEEHISNTENLMPNELTSDDFDYINQLYQQLHKLSKKKILNLTGISNTDLKLSYGVANLSLLSQYDQNYTSLIKTLQSISAFYDKFGFISLAKEYLEFSIQTNCDICATYLLLARIYFEQGELNHITSLLEKATRIPGSQNKIIDRKLKEFCQSHDLLHS